MHMVYCKQCCTHIDASDRVQRKKFEDASSKLMIVSTDRQQLAEKILEERSLSKGEAEKCVQVYAGMLERHFDHNSTVSSTQMRLILEDSSDATKAQSMTGKHGYMCNDEATDQQDDSEDAKAPKTRDLPIVNIFKGPGIWICLDEGCNSNCHGTDWAANTIEKLMKTSIEITFDWIHRRVRSFTGIGDAKVEAIGKRKCPTAFVLENFRKIIPGYLESHEQVGAHP
jgi:YesN/AraC family two-component response regulator